MITPTDLVIAWGAGVAAGLLVPVAMWAVRAVRDRAAARRELRHWRARHLFIR